MDFQWPLILFTLFISWSAGLFATSSFCVIKEEPKSPQPAFIASAVLMIIGGISVFFHLQHWERIFNGFGHITSGITQELIAIVVLAICMVATFFAQRKQNEGIPKALCIVNIAVACILVIVMGHSYMMASRPTWATIAQCLSLVGNACVLGSVSYGILYEFAAADNNRPTSDSIDKAIVLVGSIVNAITTIAFIISMDVASRTLPQLNSFFDGIHAATPIATAASYSPFATSTLGITIVSIIAVLASIVAAAFLRRRASGKAMMILILVFGIVSAVSLRMVT